MEGGFEKICGWMLSLLDMGLFADAPGETPPPCLRESPPPKKVKVESSVIPPRLLPRSRFQSTRTYPVSPPASAPIVGASTPNPLAPAQPHVPFLQSFNQAAQQRQVTVEYIATPSEPLSAGQWIVKCVGKLVACLIYNNREPLTALEANGIEMGIGYGNNKQTAKEDAARQAFYAMGWAPREWP